MDRSVPIAFAAGAATAAAVSTGARRASRA